MSWRVVEVRDSEDVHLGDRGSGRSPGHGEAELRLRGRGSAVVGGGVRQLDCRERKGRVVIRVMWCCVDVCSVVLCFGVLCCLVLRCF